MFVDWLFFAWQDGELAMGTGKCGELLYLMQLWVMDNWVFRWIVV